MPTVEAHEPAAPAFVDADGLPVAVVVAPDEQSALLDLARTALAVAAHACEARDLDAAFARAEGFSRCAAAFVTLTEDDELRGCMGNLDASRPVAESVLSAATLAARRDPRFRPVLAGELPRIHVEVSVMGPLTYLPDPLRFRLAVDGLVVERGGWRGLLLPEVATMLGSDRIEMLDTTCLKAGLARGSWRLPGTSVYAFRTHRFGGAAVPPVDAET